MDREIYLKLIKTFSSRSVAGKSYSGINDEIIYVSIGMGIIIIVLITLALCYIAHEECHKKREIYINA